MRSLSLDRFFDPDSWDGVVVTDYGFLARKRDDLGPLVYEIKVHNSLDLDQIESISGLAPLVPKDALRDLYGRCNGLNIGASKLFIYGMKLDVTSENPLTFLNSPFCLNDPNYWERKQDLPESCLVVGGSSRQSEGEKVELDHTLEVNGTISVRLAKDVTQVIQVYGNVREWLECETNLALSQVDNW